MNRLLTVAGTLLMAGTSAAACAGTISARVLAAGTGEPVLDAVVVAVPKDGLPPLPAKPRTEIVDQVDKEFVPKVKPILMGSLVQFPNKDNVRHQVYSFSPPKRFELPLYAGTPAAPLLFDKPGVVVLGCNIHDWMLGYIYVSESPYFAKTDASGNAELHVPDGSYAVRIWHPQLQGSEEDTRRNMQVTGTVEANWSLGLKKEVRVPRASTSDDGGPY